MAVIIQKNFRWDDGDQTTSGPLLLHTDGLFVGVKTGSKRSGLKKIDTFGLGPCVVRWADVTSYELRTAAGTLFMGSKVSGDHSYLTLRLADGRVQGLEVKLNPADLLTRIGAYLPA